MPETDLAVSINRSPRMSFVAGEDRVFALALKDLSEDLPLDLTDGELTFAFPRAGGGSIKRRTGALAFSWAGSSIQNGLTVITAKGHGLSTGDLVKLANALPEAALPAPFLLGASYVVVYVDADSFGLTDVFGRQMALAAPDAGAALLSDGGFLVTQPALGRAALGLPSHVTALAATGQGLTFQLTYTSPAGARRFFSGTNQLDVFAQPCP